MLALAVMVGVAYNRLPRTAEIGTNEIGSSMASQEAPAGLRQFRGSCFTGGFRTL